MGALSEKLPPGEGRWDQAPDRGSKGHGPRDGQAAPSTPPAEGVAPAKSEPEGGRRAVQEERQRFRTEVERQAARRERFRREGFRGFWLGLSSFGMVGWSIAVPTLLGIALGLWLDARLGGGRRYTISLMVAGLAMGMSNVWRWLRLQEEAEEAAPKVDAAGRGTGGTAADAARGGADGGAVDGSAADTAASVGDKTGSAGDQSPS